MSKSGRIGLHAKYAPCRALVASWRGSELFLGGIVSVASPAVAVVVVVAAAAAAVAAAAAALPKDRDARMYCGYSSRKEISRPYWS